MRSLPLAVLLAACADTPADDAVDTDVTEPFAFEPYVGLDATPDHLSERLCPAATIEAYPSFQDNSRDITCALEGADFVSAPPAPKSELVVATWNLKFGQDTDGAIAVLQDWAGLPEVDVLLVSEVDRGCSRSQARNVPWEIAEALGWSYVFGVEYVEFPRPAGDSREITDVCEHGNAIFSRYPLGNVNLLRHEENRDYWTPPEDWDQPGEPRLGGRMMLAADVDVGGRYVHVVSVHFEPDPFQYADISTAQAIEGAAHAAAQPIPTVVGGDMNAPSYTFDVTLGNATDPVVGAYLDRGFSDAHLSVPAEERGTRLWSFVIDLLVGKGVTFSEPGICPRDPCDGISDHTLIWATATLD